MTTMIFHVVWLLLFLTAPATSDVCQTFLPEGFSGTQSDDLVPFIIQPLSIHYFPGKAVTVEIQRKAENDARSFMGFVLQARNVVSGEVVGDFFSLSSFDLQGYDCEKESRYTPDDHGFTTVATRLGNILKLPFTVTWMSHYNNGTVQFRGTLIMSNSVYWTAVQSADTLSPGDTSGIQNCDGKYDCGDLACRDTKEQCPNRCSNGQFMCASSGRCIDQTLVCDDTPACGLLSSKEDENPNMCRDCRGHQCASSNKCISKSEVCDNVAQCPYSEDESFDGPYKCCVAGFLCDGGRSCINQAWVCDSVYDCDDRTDEQNCPDDGRSDNCGTHPKRCSVGVVCVGKYHLCEGEICNLSTHHSCDNGTLCLPNDRLCDGISQCMDGTDEGFTVCQRVCSGDLQYLCPDQSKCLHIRQRCDGIPHCLDGYDEDYSACYYFSTECKGFRCETRQCLPQSLVCDSVQDCKFSTDEQNCLCDINDHRLCDGTEDCADGTDEMDCGSSGRTAIIATTVIFSLLLIIAIAIAVKYRMRKRERSNLRGIQSISSPAASQPPTAASQPPTAATSPLPVINITTEDTGYQAQFTAAGYTPGSYVQRGSPAIPRTHGSPRQSRPQGSNSAPVAPPSYDDVIQTENLNVQASSDPPPPSYDSLPSHLKEDRSSQNSSQGLLTETDTTEHRHSSPSPSFTLRI